MMYVPGNTEKFTVLILFISFLSTNISSQEIDFGSYSSTYSMTLTEVNPGSDLDFGTVYQNLGTSSVPLINSVGFAIEGVKYLDVIVDITADDYLLLDGNPSCLTNPSCRIPFTLQAAYANRGLNNTNQAILISTIGNTATAQFPIKYRGNAPPGPPPTPVYQGYNPASFNETAYLYIYGSISIGAVDVGTYSSNISITINYD